MRPNTYGAYEDAEINHYNVNNDYLEVMGVQMIFTSLNLQLQIFYNQGICFFHNQGNSVILFMGKGKHNKTQKKSCLRNVYEQKFYFKMEN